jgi:hypothetical protein
MVQAQTAIGSRRFWLGALPVAALLLFKASVSTAAPLTHFVTGTVSSVDPDLAGYFTVGDFVTYTFTFDPTAPDSEPDPAFGVYSSFMSAVGTVGSYSFTASGLTDIFVDDAVFDGIAMEEAVAIGAALDGNTLVGAELVNLLGAGTAHASDALSLPPDLSQYSILTGSRLVFDTGVSTAFVEWSIDTWTAAVPGPASAVLLLLGAGTAFGVLRTTARRGRRVTARRR